jgi:hypothetical protein
MRQSSCPLLEMLVRDQVVMIQIPHAEGQSGTRSASRLGKLEGGRSLSPTGESGAQLPTEVVAERTTARTGRGPDGVPPCRGRSRGWRARSSRCGIAGFGQPLGRYRRRAPERTVLHELVAGHAQTLIAGRRRATSRCRARATIHGWVSRMDAALDYPLLLIRCARRDDISTLDRISARG